MIGVLLDLSVEDFYFLVRGGDAALLSNDSSVHSYFNALKCFHL